MTSAPAPTATNSASPSASKLGRRLFTTGGVWLLILGAIHAVSLVRPLAPQNETERQLISLMTSYKFNLAGSMRSMEDLLTGFSVSFMLAALVLGALAMTLRREPAAVLRRVALVIVLYLAAMTAVTMRFFFIFPTTFLVIALLLFLGSWLTLRSEN
jgi:hypothetical protein